MQPLNTDSQSLGEQASYAQLNKVLQYPVNPAYLGSENKSNQQSDLT